METGKTRDPFDIFWALGLAAAGLVAVWWLWGTALVRGWFRLKLVELELAAALTGADARIADLASALRGALTAPDRISFDAFVFGLEAVGRYWRGPAAALLAALALALLWFHPAARFRRRFDLRGLAEAMAASWPFALHALRRDNLNLPLDHPVWGMGLSGPQFLRRHALVAGRAPDGWSLREVRAGDVFADQLGAPWPDAAAAPHVRALAGLLALRAAAAVSEDQAAVRWEQSANVLWKHLARAAARNKAGDYLPAPDDYTPVIQETERFLEADAVRPMVAGHAHTATVLLRLLEEARHGGILPSAWFTWLKGVDRPLWYALCSLGRRAYFVEGLGALAHYQAERRAGTALATPAVGAAVRGLADAMNQLPDATLAALAAGARPDAAAPAGGAAT